MSRDKDEPARMFGYWVEDKGLYTALNDYYPNTIASNPTIRQNVTILLMCEMTPEPGYSRFVDWLTTAATRLITKEFARLAELEPEYD